MQARDETSVADSNEAAFRAMAQLETSDDDFEESDIEGEMQRRRQRGRGGAKTVEEKRVVKAAGDKKRRAVARREQDLLINAGRAPRVLDVLRLVNFSATGELAIGRVFKGRADAALTFAEYCESQRRGTWFLGAGGAAHPCSNVKPCTNLSAMVGMCGASSCHFAYDVRRQRKASGDGFEWKLCKFVPHDALCGKLRAPTAGAEPAKKPRVVKRKERRCAYSSADLGRFLLEHQQTSKTSFTLATAKALLAPVVWMVSTNELAQRASAAATELMQGTPAYNHKMLPWLIDALKALGYHAGLVELTATEMDAILLARAKHDHHQAQKKFPKSKRSDFDASAVVEGKAVVAKAVPGSRFYGGWYAFCPTAKKMLEAGVLRKLFQADFCGAKGRGKGSFGVLMAGDAGSHHVFVGATHSIINESELAWDGLIKPAKEFLGSLIDGADVGIVADADKGGAASIAKVCPQSKKLVCMVHRGETAAKGDTEGASLRYKACVLATTDEMQRRALGKLTPKGLAFVNKLPFGVQFMLQNPGIFYGKPTSKQVESANWALMEMRRCATPGAALKTFLEYGEEQYLKHSAEAVATRTHTTAAVILELAKLEADAPVLCSRLVWVNEFAGKGRVYSRLKTGLYFDVNLGAAAVTCSCGVPRVNTKLCAHIAFGCGKFRRSLEECVFIDDTAVRFRQQSAAGGTWPVPHFDVDEEDLPENHLAMPLANPAPRGRPKTLRGKRGINAAVKEAAKRMRLQTKTTILDLTVSDDDDEQDDDDAFIDDDRGDDGEESDEEGSDDDEAEEGDSEAEEGDSEAEEDGDDDDDAAEATLPRFRPTTARCATAMAAGFVELPSHRAA